MRIERTGGRKTRQGGGLTPAAAAAALSQARTAFDALRLRVQAFVCDGGYAVHGGSLRPPPPPAAAAAVGTTKVMAGFLSTQLEWSTCVLALPGARGACSLLSVLVVGPVACGTQWLSCSMHGSMGRALNSSAVECRMLWDHITAIGQD